MTHVAEIKKIKINLNMYIPWATGRCRVAIGSYALLAELIFHPELCVFDRNTYLQKGDYTANVTEFHLELCA